MERNPMAGQGFGRTQETADASPALPARIERAAQLLPSDGLPGGTGDPESGICGAGHDTDARRHRPKLRQIASDLPRRSSGLPFVCRYHSLQGSAGFQAWLVFFQMQAALFPLPSGCRRRTGDRLPEDCRQPPKRKQVEIIYISELSQNFKTKQAYSNTLDTNISCTLKNNPKIITIKKVNFMQSPEISEQYGCYTGNQGGCSTMA